jgi:dihydropteroate synthase
MREINPVAARLTVLGILNVTPDSFSDGGRWRDLGAAVAHGVDMRASGADFVDVGGESTRPGAGRVAADEELRRVMPVVRALVHAGVPVSIDTTRAAVADAALSAGAEVVNDVSGGRADPDMARVVRDAGCRWVLMHSRGVSSTMRNLASYGDVVREVVAELAERVDAAVAVGVAAERLVVDPGLGFAKRPRHDWRLLACLGELRAIGLPVLVGASRKSFLGPALADQDGHSRPPSLRDDATAAVTVWAAIAGAWGVRVHDVRRSVDAALTTAAICRAGCP